MRTYRTVLLTVVALVALVLFAVAASGSATPDAQRENSNNRSVPTGAVMSFDLTECPPGWSTFADAQGRVIVGGETGVAVGTSLASGEDRTHQHVWSESIAGDWESFDSSGARVTIMDWHDGIDGSGFGFYPLGVWGQRSEMFYTDAAATSDLMPYIQLLTCVKK